MAKEKSIVIPAAEEVAAEKPAEIDPFDLSVLRLDQDYENLSGVSKILTMVPVRRPHKQTFVRVRPGSEWRFDTLLLELKEEKELYLVAPNMRDELLEESIAVTLHTSIDRQGNLFLWPVRLPDSQGKDNPYWMSSRLAIQHAETNWIRCVANMRMGLYDVFRASNPLAFPDPEWPNLSFQEILRLAFKLFLISDVEHPVFQRLRGLA